MESEHQDLTTEFPELAARISTLRSNHPHFARRLAEFDALTAEIEHIERNDAASGSSSLEVMKKQRLALKDELYQMLQSES